jgi:prophage regulatory protein
MSTLNNPCAAMLVAEGASRSIEMSRSTVANQMTACQNAIKLLRLPQVMEMTGLRKTKIYELNAEGAFPRRVRITAHSVGWVEAEVQAWLAQRVESSAQASRIPGPAR